MIKSWLTTNRLAYPNLESLTLVGDDRIIPFRRIPDETPLANERTYQLAWTDENPESAALKSGYFLSDNYYASFTPLPWRGRGLYIPDYGIGRLVETPKEIAAYIDRFLNAPFIRPSRGLVVGYDFLSDQARAISASMSGAGLSVQEWCWFSGS